jgi:anti-sigma factor RsiW
VSDLDCSEFVELVTSFLDGALEPADRRRFAAHLAECDGCERYLDQVRRTIRALGDLPAERLPPQARDALLAALRNLPR